MAQTIVEKFDGKFPLQEKDLLTLPGIGPKTAERLALSIASRPKAKIEELEKMNILTVNRELKMVELKKELESLKANQSL